MSEKILSIAIAVYNMEEYLSRCIDSLLVPDILDKIEILIINDGSRDRSAKIARNYQLRYPYSVRVFEKENGGYGSAINLAIDKAQGKYFKTLDADDWFDSQALQRFVNELEKVDIDLVITHYSNEYDKSTVSFPVLCSGVEFGNIYDFTNFSIIGKLSIAGFAMHSMAYRTEILRIDNFRMSTCYYSDVDYSTYPLVNVKTILFLDIILYKYLLGREGQSVSWEGFVKHIDDHFFITRRLIDFYSDHYSDSEQSIAVNIGCKAVNIMMNHLGILFGPLYMKDKDRAEREIRNFIEYIQDRDSDMYALVEEQIRDIRNEMINNTLSRGKIVKLE